MENLDELRGLHADLHALSASCLIASDRLWVELESFLPDFKNLLDKPPRNKDSRDKVVSKANLTFAGEEYAVNEEFSQWTLAIADYLDLDELEAGRLLLSSQDESLRLEQPLFHTAISRFHERRQLLLECLRLILHESLQREPPEDGLGESEDLDATQIRLQEFVSLILDIKTGPPSNGSAYTRKSLSAMVEVEKFLQTISEQAQKASIVGRNEGPEAAEVLDLQRTSLLLQHESLGAIICYLFKAGYTSSEDLRHLIKRLKQLNRFDNIMVHYLPSIAAALTQYGSGHGTLREARSLHRYIVSTQDSHEPWGVQVLHAAVVLLWLAEYSGWYLNPGAQSPLEGVDLPAESEQRSKAAVTALNDGGLELILAVCAGTTVSDEWHDPARQEVVVQLLRDTTGLTLEGEKISAFLRNLLMEQLIGFSESWITNMPDTIRRLKAEEDDQRLRRITFAQEGLDANLQHDSGAVHSHLECFLVIISFAFEHQTDFSLDFWEPEGNFFGFLQWASKRQTVPRVSAFCEMLCSISEGEDCAKSAHVFLLDASQASQGKFRKSPSMNYAQMFDELYLYSEKVKERSSITQSMPQIRKVKPTEMNELESPVMLACYLRLMAHMSQESPEARQYLLEHRIGNKADPQTGKETSVSLVPIILELGRGPIPSYLRASIFRTLKALLTDKTSHTSSEMWLTLEDWFTGASLGVVGSTKSLQPLQQQTWTDWGMFQTIGATYDQSKDFVALLRSLVSPATDSGTLNDALPFPESIGSANRMPGIEPYIDFAIGQVFAKKVHELPDESQIRLLKWNCLDFTASCLETFNENLVVVANQSTISVDSIMASSSLAIYIERHPFARVMEWLFSDEVIKALFSCAHQAISEIIQASSTSVLVTGLARSIDILNLVLRLQPTYLDIVRPFIKRLNAHRDPVPNSGLASFEDSIAANTQLIADLCIYCGAGHEELTVKSLELLQKLSVSRRLYQVSPTSRHQHRLPTKILETLDAEVDSWQVGQSLVRLMQLDIRELEVGPNARGYLIKDSILAFLEACLAALPNIPNIAHFFLGFRAVGESLDVSDSLFAEGISLLHSVLFLARDYPEGRDGSLLSWMIHVRKVSLQVLKHLWTSPLSSVNTLIELRKQNFLSAQFLSQGIISPNTLWNGLVTTDPAFLTETSAEALVEFLLCRGLLLDYAVMEIRASSHERSPSLEVSVLSTLSGRSADISGEVISHASLFDLFDFADIDVRLELPLPELKYLLDVDINLCVQEVLDDRYVIYDLNQVRQLVELCLSQNRKKGVIATASEQETLDLEVGNLFLYLHSQNYEALIQFARRKALRSWVDLLMTTIGSFSMDTRSKVQFILQALQIILPKLDSYILGAADEAIELAKLAESLVDNLEVASQSQEKGRVANVINDRLHQLFRICIEGIHRPDSPPRLREILYNICSQFLARINDETPTNRVLRRNSMETIMSADEPLINVACDDADAGQENCRLSAVLMLNLLAALAKSENSAFLVDAFVRLNFFEVLVDPIKGIIVELQETEPQDIPLLLEYYEARLSLLLQLSQSRIGAGNIVDAGLFQAIRDSGLFTVDPDLGIDFDNPMALRRYYELLSSITRVVISTVLSRGLYHEQTLFQIRNLLREYRPNIVGTFKRYAGIGGSVPASTREALAPLVKSYTALLSLVDFINFEEEEQGQKLTPKAFS